jgi:sulfite exporter TauE/SafE
MTGSFGVDLLMILAGGLLGSAHCIGMCGGFALTLGLGAVTWKQRVLRQLLYATGRVSVYTFAGSAAGYAGWKLQATTQSLFHVQAIVAIAAGVLLFAEGCRSLGWLPRWTGSTTVCPLASLGSLLRSKRSFDVFAAGVWNGLLPCGLVYAYLAIAAATRDVLAGGAVMAVFGLGTIPALALTGLAGSTLSVRFRHRVFQIAAICLLVTGVMTVARGAALFTVDRDEPACPLCR